MLRRIAVGWYNQTMRGVLLRYLLGVLPFPLLVRLWVSLWQAFDHAGDPRKFPGIFAFSICFEAWVLPVSLD